MSISRPWAPVYDKWNLHITRNCACNARYVPLQVMDLQVKYHYYSMHIFRDMDLNQKFNQSRWCVKCRSKWAESHWAVEHYPRLFHIWSIITMARVLCNMWTWTKHLTKVWCTDGRTCKGNRFKIMNSFQ